MSERSDVLVVGAGQGGASVALGLRQMKFAGTITVLGAEPELPYERPALSKEYLAGDKAFDKLLLRPAEFWREKDVTFVLGAGARVMSVDPAEKTATTADGRIFRYGTLVWAAGGRPRRLPCAGPDGAGVHYVRSRADVDRIQRELATTTRIAVIGGGYIGLEAASVLRKKDKAVTLFETEGRVLARVAGVELSRFFEDEHRRQGVDVRLRSEVVAIEGEGEGEGRRVTGVKLASGEIVAADMVIVGIGIVPEVEPLLAAGAEGKASGVVVDLLGRTSLPDVYACGDCAAHANVHEATGDVVRLESIQNANDQASVLVRHLTGALADGERYDALPWFWSTQFDLRLQTAGLVQGYDEEIVRGDPGTRSFSVVYRREGRVIAVDCVNRTKDYVQGKMLITSRRVVDRGDLANPERLLKDLAARTDLEPKGT